MKKYFAEFTGTFALVFMGTGAIITNDISGGAVSHVGVSLTFGLAVMTIIYAIGDVSGAHLNPAVSLGFFMAKRFPGREVLPYIVAQAGGAIAASFTLKALFPLHETLGSTMPSGSILQAFVLEAILALFLMFVILNVSTGSMEKGIMAGVAVGGVVAMEALFAGPVTGASMNPARSLGPALASANLEHLWVYLSATSLGAVIAPFLLKRVRSEQ